MYCTHKSHANTAAANIDVVVRYDHIKWVRCCPSVYRRSDETLLVELPICASSLLSRVWVREESSHLHSFFSLSQVALLCVEYHPATHARWWEKENRPTTNIARKTLLFWCPWFLFVSCVLFFVFLSPLDKSGVIKHHHNNTNNIALGEKGSNSSVNKRSRGTLQPESVRHLYCDTITKQQQPHWLSNLSPSISSVVSERAWQTPTMSMIDAAEDVTSFAANVMIIKIGHRYLFDVTNGLKGSCYYSRGWYYKRIGTNCNWRSFLFSSVQKWSSRWPPTWWWWTQPWRRRWLVIC